MSMTYIGRGGVEEEEQEGRQYKETMRTREYLKVRNRGMLQASRPALDLPRL